MPDTSYPMVFYAVDSQNQIVPFEPSPSSQEYSKNEQELHLWNAVVNRIKQTASEHQLRLTFPKEPGPDAETIQVLFVKIEHLKNKAFYFNLIDNSPLRQTINLQRFPPGQIDKNNRPRPIITIGAWNNIMRIYEELPYEDFLTEGDDGYWKQSREKDKLLYSFQLDHRVKFLDSSIWHRYIGIGDQFEEQFVSLLNKVITYCDFELYQSLAALATLEFQCRILKNSFIAKFGTRGHHEAVTPFKFHSETMMALKAEKYLKFFNRKLDGEKRLTDLRWSILMIDDYANTPISIVDEENDTSKDRKTKKDVVEHWLNEGQVDSGNNAKGFEFSITDCTEKADSTISSAINLLKKNLYDIVLLDYLLGNSELQPEANLKAYGHEFLLELATSNERHELKRGPFGKYWIFPISSFPFAFTDKLKQLNMDGSTNDWVLASGADPISAPELFRLNFFRLLMDQISYSYKTEMPLARMIQRFHSIDKNKKTWYEAIVSQFEAIRLDEKLLINDGRRESIFAKKMEDFLNHQDSYKGFLRNLEKWVNDFMSYYEGQSAADILDQLSKIESDYPKYATVCKCLRNQAKNYIFDPVEELLAYARQLRKNGKTKLEFVGKSLPAFPIQLYEIVPNLEVINLSGNQIMVIPEIIGMFENLQHLNLENNPTLTTIAAKQLIDRQRLLSLNLDRTELGKLIEKRGEFPFTNSLEATKSLLQNIHNIQNNRH